MRVGLFSRPRPAESKPSSATRPRRSGFIHSVLSFTRLDIPTLEVYETAVAFGPDTDPITAHKELADVFGQKAGEGEFLFRADSTIAGRYWVQSVVPWTRWPETAVSALEPKRAVIQLAEGLMYRFTLHVCAGTVRVDGGEKQIVPFTQAKDVDQWLRGNAPRYGFNPLMVDVSMQTLRFTHRGTKVRIDYAAIEGALEVTHPEDFKRRLRHGFGHHRRAGLGLIQLTA
jgi:CRISPR-associated protein Cas6/Cse3/CasE subtype I-E